MEPVNITVLTASVPRRSKLLREAIASVLAQTVPVAAHLIRIQQPPRGKLSPRHIAEQSNALLAAVDTEWAAPLGDDDLYLPHHVDTIAEHLEGADLVYTWPTRKDVSARIDVSDWPQSRLVRELEQGNFIPSTLTFRTEILHQVGGWGRDHRHGVFSETGVQWEDWDLLIRLARAGARFRCVPVVTWEYRVGPWEHTIFSQAEPQEVRVLEASYGTGELFADVTKVVESHIRDGRLTFEVTNDVLGVDPAVNQVKVLKVICQIDGVRVERSFPEGGVLTLP